MKTADDLKEAVREGARQIVKLSGVCTFNDAAGVLAEVINAELDAGHEFSDEQIEDIATVLEDFD